MRLVKSAKRDQHRRDMQAFGESIEATRHMGGNWVVTAMRAVSEGFPIDASVSHMSISGQPLYTVNLRDVTAQKQAQSELESSHADLRHLIAAQDKVQEDERSRISRELHDDLQQNLAAIRIDLRRLGAGRVDHMQHLKPLVVSADDHVAQVVASSPIRLAHRPAIGSAAVARAHGTCRTTRGATMESGLGRRHS